MRITNIVTLLGRYTLLAYIFQMFVIQIGHALLSKVNLHELTYYFGNLSASAVVLCMFIFMFDHLRQRIHVVDSAYSIVFG